MTDIDLLKRAAKAAGYEVARVADDGRGLMLVGVQEPWNPLDDDGDAFRLAVRKCFHVCVFAASDIDGIKSPGFIEVWQDGDSDPLVMEYVSEDAYQAAARRAIVEAVVKIGKEIAK